MGDNMLTTQFLKSRTSTRDFKDMELNKADLEKLDKIIDSEIIKLGKDDLAFIVQTDGEKVFKALEGKAGYKGVMIKAPAYLALNILNDDPASLVKGAYGVEELITELDNMGIGNCWITVADVEDSVKKGAFDYDKGEVRLLLAIGYPVDETVREHQFDDRKGIGEFVFIDQLGKKATNEDLEQRGLDEIFAYARFAPSAYNAQPWRFVLVDDLIKLYIEDYKGEVNLLDAGIIMYYLDKLGESISMGSKWDIKPEINDDKYVYIASKQL